MTPELSDLAIVEVVPETQSESITWISKQSERLDGMRKDHPMRRWIGLSGALVLFSVAAFRILLSMETPVPFTLEEEIQAVEIAMLLAVQEVEAVWATTGDLPETVNTSFGAEQISYERLSRSRYRLLGQVNDSTFVRAYLSGDPQAPLERIVRGMQKVTH